MTSLLSRPRGGEGEVALRVSGEPYRVFPDTMYEPEVFLSDSRIILVLGATGRQGGASAHQLVKRGWQVRALVRDQQKPASEELRDVGVELVTGDLDDEDSVRRAMSGVYGVHSVQSHGDHPAEVRRGKLVADLAKEIGVNHLVYSSVGGAERNSGIDHFETKGEIERYIADLGLPATVLRPVFFINNFSMFLSSDGDGNQVLSAPLPADLSLQVIAADDIGYFVANAFDSPEEYLGEQIEIAGEELTLSKAAAAHQRGTGVPTTYHEIPREQALEMFGGEKGVRMFDWFRESGYQADVRNLRRKHPDLLTVEDFVRQNA